MAQKTIQDLNIHLAGTACDVKSSLETIAVNAAVSAKVADANHLHGSSEATLDHLFVFRGSSSLD